MCGRDGFVILLLYIAAVFILIQLVVLHSYDFSC